MKKICIYMPTASYIIGGAENVSINQAIYLHKYGYDITFISIKHKKKTDDFKMLENLKIKTVYLDCNNIDEEIINNITLSHTIFHQLYYFLGEKLYHYFIKNSFDLVVSHYSPAGIFIPSNIKSCIILHGTPFNIDESDKVGVYKSKYRIAVSESIKIGRDNLLEKKININVVHNGVNHEKYYYQNIINKDIDVFFIGRNIEIKGIQYLIQAINYLKNNYNLNLKVVIGGTGPYQKNLIDMVLKYKLENNILFVGYVEGNELAQYYNNSKIIALPSYAKEGVLTTMLESASCQCCILTCNCCGMMDFIVDGYNGIFCEPQNYKDLGEKIKILIQDGGLRQKLGYNARQEILKYRTWERSILNFTKITNI